MLLHYNAKYKVLLCRIHKYAIEDPERHLRQEHFLAAKECEALGHEWSSVELCTARQSRSPPNDQEERSWLATPVDGYSCTGCEYLTSVYADLVEHWLRHHRLDLRDIPPPTFSDPKSYARCVRMQTLFEPRYRKWFTVVPAQKLLMLNKFVLKMGTHRKVQQRNKQRMFAAQHQECNERHSFLHRLPPEIRIRIYDHALADQVTYPIEDMLAPGASSCNYYETGTDDDHYHSKWRCTIETDIQSFHQHDGTFKLRAISLPSNSGSPVALLQTCTLINREASAIFYSRNHFFIRSRWGNWTSVNQFLGLLRPHIRQYSFRNLGVVDLRPTWQSNPEPHGHHYKQASLYYLSMKNFLDNFIPQLSLKTLTLCVDLRDLSWGTNSDIDYSPQAPWLNPFLRLSQSEVEIRIVDDRSSEYADDHISFESPGSQLVDRLNAIDFRIRIRAQWYFSKKQYIGIVPDAEKVKWRNITPSLRRKKNEENGRPDLDIWEFIGIPISWDDMGDEERVEWRNTTQRYKNQKGGYSYLDIWAQCATEGYVDTMAIATNPYENQKG
ncbi:MAG: hypothetical protein Q9170_004095 [Blastenia crenularia]